MREVEPTIESWMQLSCGKMSRDTSRTNMEEVGVFPWNTSFRFDRVGLMVAAEDDLLRQILSGLKVDFSIGHFSLTGGGAHAGRFAGGADQMECLDEVGPLTVFPDFFRTLSVRDACRPVLQNYEEEMKRRGEPWTKRNDLVVPPRQSFRVDLHLTPELVETLQAVQQREAEDAALVSMALRVYFFGELSVR
jgi:hypothetical protein